MIGGHQPGLRTIKKLTATGQRRLRPRPPRQRSQAARVRVPAGSV